MNKSIDGLNFACYLIDHCERETVTEEAVQRWIGRAMADPKYATAQAAPAVPAGEALSEVLERNFPWLEGFCEQHGGSLALAHLYELKVAIDATLSAQTAVQPGSYEARVQELTPELGKCRAIARADLEAQSREQPQPVHSTGELEAILKSLARSFSIMPLRPNYTVHTAQEMDEWWAKRNMENSQWVRDTAKQALAVLDAASDTAAGAQKPKGPELDAAPLPELLGRILSLLEVSRDAFEAWGNGTTGHDSVIASLRERLSAPSQQQPQASCLPPAQQWISVEERLPEPSDICDWLYPVSELKGERWMLCAESMVTASVPGRATHWRLAQSGETEA